MNVQSDETRLRVLIVDDERLARAKVRRFLEEIGDCEIIAECANSLQALEILASREIDVLFLDVQMPEMSGLELIRHLNRLHTSEVLEGSSNLVSKHIPLVVFITAFDHYAIPAFQHHALDYLVKPFDFERFSAAVARVRGMCLMQEAAQKYREQIAVIAKTSAKYPMYSHAHLQASSQPHLQSASDISSEERFVFRTRGKITLLEANNVDWIEADGNYAVFHAGQHKYLLRETLSSLESRLNPALFLRIHRSAIVRISFLSSLELHEDGSYQAVFKDSTRCGVGPTYREGVRRALGLSV